MKMKRFNEEVYTGSPKVNLSCFREFDELERCLRYSDLKKFMVCACLPAGRLFQKSGALLVNESMPGREEGQNGRREFPLPLVWWECSVKLSLVHRERGADFRTHLRTTTANWSAQPCSIDVKRWFFKMGAISACQSAPATQRTARLHTEQRWSRKEVDMKGIVNSLLSGSFLVNSSLSAPTKIEELTVLLSLSELKEKSWLWKVSLLQLHTQGPVEWLPGRKDGERKAKAGVCFFGECRSFG